MNRPDTVDAIPDDAPHAEPTTTRPADLERASTTDPSGEVRRPKGLGCLCRAVLFVVLLGGGLYVANYVYQGRVAAEVDPADVQPLIITVDEPTETAASGDDADAAESPDDPGEKSLTAGIDAESIAQASHPLLPLLEVATRVRDHIRESIRDYEAVIIKQVRVDGKLGDEQYMLVRIRHPRKEGDREIPFSVYTRFLKPRASAGQEAIWIKGHHDNKIIAHPAGLWNLVRVELDPDGPLAMKGNRYPVYYIGMLNLVEMMLEKGEAGKQVPDCQVRVQRGIQVDGVDCCMLEITYPTRHPEIDFYQARIFIDTQRDIPIAYEGYLWPESEGADPPLLEKYFYTNIRLNVGLADEDFDPDNPNYNFPGSD